MSAATGAVDGGVPVPPVVDSDRRCPRDSKRMVVEVGQDENSGWTRMVHVCLNCEYREIDENWARPRLAKTGGRSAAERLAALRLGVEVPMVYRIWSRGLPSSGGR